MMNNSGWGSSIYDNLVKQAQSETDPLKAMKLMRDAEDVLMAEMPPIPLYYRSFPKMTAPYGKGQDYAF